MKNSVLELNRLIASCEAGEISEGQMMARVLMAAKRYNQNRMKVNEDRPLPSRMGTARKTHRPLRQYC